MDYFYNVKFSVLTSVYDDTLKIRVLAPNPVVSNVPAHFVDTNSGLERSGSTGSEVGRSPRYKMNVQLSTTQRAAITSGSVLLVTHRKHPDTLKWVLLDQEDQQQFIVQADSDSWANAKYVVLSLTRKDQS